MQWSTAELAHPKQLLGLLHTENNKCKHYKLNILIVQSVKVLKSKCSVFIFKSYLKMKNKVMDSIFVALKVK